MRSGVPNADAVIALGSGQSEIEDRFTGLLDDVAGPRKGSSGRASMLLGAGFGEGKSHLLTHLGHLATSAGFVVSTVVVSKETPLHDPAKVLRAAVESAVGPDGSRDVIAEAAAALDTDSPAYADLLRWLRGPGRDMNERFDATDDLAGILVVAVVPPDLVSDEKRGLPSYAALQLRVADEVRDRRRTNPFASLVRLDVRLEAVR